MLFPNNPASPALNLLNVLHARHSRAYVSTINYMYITNSVNKTITIHRAQAKLTLEFPAEVVILITN